MSAIVVNACSGSLAARLSGHRYGSLFSSPEWIGVLTRTYGIEVSASVSADGCGEDAILFSHISDVRGERVVSLPFSDYCDPLVSDTNCWKRLVEPLLLLNAPMRMRCLQNHLPAEDARFTLQRSGKWHGIDLTRPEDQMWAGLASQARQNIRRAKQCGVAVREGKSLSDVRLFHRMHTYVRKSKYRLLAQPFAFFENLHETFSHGDRICVLIAELNGEPLAGILLLQWRNTLYYKFNASFDQRHRPNDLLVWYAMVLGHRRGCAMLDFGLSEIEQPGLVRYKRKFATEEHDICFFEAQGGKARDARSDEVSKILGCVTELLTDPAVPERISQAAGEKFYRLFA